MSNRATLTSYLKADTRRVRNKLYILRTDKNMAKRFIAQKFPETFGVPGVLFYGKNVNDINFAALPKRYVIKANNGSGRNIFVHADKNICYLGASKRAYRFSIEKVKSICVAWLATPYGDPNGECLYRSVTPHIIIENLYNVDIEYKFHVINGKVCFIEYVKLTSGSVELHKWFTTKWEPLHISQVAEGAIGPSIKKPHNLGSMIENVNRITSSDKIDYVRFDTFQSGNKVYFGKYTFRPCDLAIDYSPLQFDAALYRILQGKAGSDSLSLFSRVDLSNLEKKFGIRYHNIHGSRLLLVNSDSKLFNRVRPIAWRELEKVRKMFDRTILYSRNKETKLYDIVVLEKNGCESKMCGNGLLAMGEALIRKLPIFVNSGNRAVKVSVVPSTITINLAITAADSRIICVEGEPHTVLCADTYDRKQHILHGRSNAPRTNTTFIYRDGNRYCFATYERGVNGITEGCGTGAIAGAHFLSTQGRELSEMYTINCDKYEVKKTGHLMYTLKYPADYAVYETELIPAADDTADADVSGPPQKQKNREQYHDQPTQRQHRQTQRHPPARQRSSTRCGNGGCARPHSARAPHHRYRQTQRRRLPQQRQSVPNQPRQQRYQYPTRRRRHAVHRRTIKNVYRPAAHANEQGNGDLARSRAGRYGRMRGLLGGLGLGRGFTRSRRTRRRFPLIVAR